MDGSNGILVSGRIGKRSTMEKMNFQKAEAPKLLVRLSPHYCKNDNDASTLYRQNNLRLDPEVDLGFDPRGAAWTMKTVVTKRPRKIEAGLVSWRGSSLDRVALQWLDRSLKFLY